MDVFSYSNPSGTITRTLWYTGVMNIWERFIEAVIAQGGRVIEPFYLGAIKGHRVICAQGHECSPSPNNVLNRGQGICRKCSAKTGGAKRTEKLRVEFIQAMTSMRGEIRGPILDNMTPVLVSCFEGHESSVTPSNVFRAVKQGKGFCKPCGMKLNGQRMRDEARRRFIEIVISFGARMVGDYVDAHTPVLLICKNGHECSPQPRSVFQGQGICLTCESDPRAMYLTVNSDMLKFGIASSLRHRLSVHRIAYGLLELHTWTDLPQGVARATETDLLREMAARGFSPMIGREYFSITLLPIVQHFLETRLGN